MPLADHLIGSKVYLRPPTPNDYPALYEIEIAGWAANRWRFGGQVPSFDAYVQMLWSSVHAQYLVIGRGTEHPVGLVTAYNADHANGHAYLAVLRFGADDTSGLVLHGTLLFIGNLFRTWRFRKLYLETTERNLQHFEGVHRHVDEQGRLVDHVWSEGRYWDLVILALTRERWAAELEERATALVGEVAP